MKPTELMRACGSESGQWRPESPEQWAWLLKNGQAEERALAWVKMTSVGRGSPFCIGLNGQPLRAAAMATECGWSTKTAQKYCTELVHQGRLTIKKGKQLWYRANVPAASDQSAADSKSPVQGTWPTYVLDFIQSLPAAERAEKLAVLGRLKDRKDQGLAELVAHYRAHFELVEVTTFQAIGVSKKVLPKKPLAEPRHVQLHLVPVMSLVQGILQPTDADPVQTTEAEVYSVEAGSVQRESGAASLSGVVKTDPTGVPAAQGVPRLPAAAAALIPEKSVQAVLVRCAELGIQLPDRRLAASLVARFPRIDPAKWPKFAEQFSPGLWLQKSPDEMAMEAVRQDHTLSGAKASRVLDRMKAANAQLAARAAGK